MPPACCVDCQSDRSVAPIVGLLALLSVTVLLGAVVAIGVGSFDVGGEPSSIVVSVSAESETNRIVLTHRYGEPISVSEVDVEVSIDGEPLATQPPVPFFQADGFRGGPTGPFNERADPRWEVGERAGFAIAATNAPTIGPGDEVVVTIVVDGDPIARASTTAD
ncbi:type IV pilin N-terminal domain-containing protein [Halovivax cerinus]|uniref:Type IV pilin N-terminal domain-containing protein n=1 Tax=Halovivax cerinus TaxID=1487865 RepID=A0ABD5NLN4_9EURY|nr:type IV pilin N-terminal domain-containing protein [Halovivax cerinus]